MHRRQISFSQPEPGKKASNKYSERLRQFEKHKMGTAGIPVAAGFTAGLVLYLLRLHQLNDEISRRNENIHKLNKLKTARESTQGTSAYVSNTSVDNFLQSAKAEMAKELRGEIANSDALILQMESDIPGYPSARDGALTMTAFAAAMILGIAGIKALAIREERAAALGKKAEAPPPARERKVALAMEDIGHADTCMPAPVAPPKEEVPEPKSKRPKYYDEVFPDLKKSIREEMGSLGSEEATEAFLCVMHRSEIEELINWPETIAVHIEKNRDRLKEFLKEKKVDPRHLFARLGREVTDLF